MISARLRGQLLFFLFIIGCLTLVCFPDYMGQFYTSDFVSGLKKLQTDYKLNATKRGWRLQGTGYIEPGVPEYNKDGEPKLLMFNRSKCNANSGEQITLLYVYTSPKNVLQREFIRKAYGNETLFAKYHLRTIFVLGKQGTEKTISPEIVSEQNRNQDLVVGDFIEAYRNLARKGLTALNFMHHWCKNSRFVIKADDDTIVDMRILLGTLFSDLKNKERFFLGSVRRKSKPRRCTPWHRWCVTQDVYNKTYNPPYMLGMGFAYTYDMVADMYTASFHVPLHPVDDMYMTGILVENLNKRLVNLGGRFLSGFKRHTMQRLREGKKFIVGHTKDIDDMREAWKMLNQKQS